MATCREIITAAYRRAGILGRHVSAPSAQDAARGLEILQDWYEGLIGSGAFGRQCDVAVTADYSAREQDRITLSSTDAITVTFPDTVTDTWFTPCCWLTTSSGPRPCRDGSIITIGDLFSTTRFAYVYDGAYAAWTPFHGLTLDSWAPLSVRYAKGIKANLAALLADEVGIPITPLLALEAKSGVAAMLLRFDGPRRDTVMQAF